MSESTPAKVTSTAPNFSGLLKSGSRRQLSKQLNVIYPKRNGELPSANITDSYLQAFAVRWQRLKQLKSTTAFTSEADSTGVTEFERQLTDWFIALFNCIFTPQNVRLVRGNTEPEYFPATKDSPAQIVFAHGYFASAIHEVSHWCIAGQRRRGLVDYGYWYAADGRSEAQQQAFERVEIKPQALECLISLTCDQPFRVSQDNLSASFDTSASTFSQDVYTQALLYITKPQILPRDARSLLTVLLKVCK